MKKEMRPFILECNSNGQYQKAIGHFWNVIKPGFEDVCDK